EGPESLRRHIGSPRSVVAPVPDIDRAAFDLAHGLPMGEVSLLIPDHEFKRGGVRRILCGISVFEQKRNLSVVMDGANLDGLDRDLLDPLLPMNLGRQWKLCDGKRIPD